MWRGRFGFLLIVLGVAGCAGPRAQEMETPPLPKDAILYQATARQTFDRIVRTLEKSGYETEIVDPQAGFIRSRPKDLDIKTQEQIHYKGFYVVRVGPRREGSFALIDFIVVPELPAERENLRKQLEQEGLR
jgi:hypothetical protein